IKVHVDQSHHWSARGILDRNKALWAAYTIETPGGNIYFAGDTGYGDGDHFRYVKDKHGDYRFAILPIGAYEPRWFMKYSHMNPPEAILAYQDLGEPYSIAAHFDVFKLTDEGYGEAGKFFEREKEKSGANNFKILEVGQSWNIPDKATSASQISKTKAAYVPIDLSTARKSRKDVSDGMLVTYGKEVPLFKIMHDVVRKVNTEYFEEAKTERPKKDKLFGHTLEQYGNIRHAAVRLALPEEMEMLTRIMNQMGMFPVAYYDLTKSGTPVKSTAFRPIHEKELTENAFTIFSSLLDIKAIDFSSNPKLKNTIADVIKKRRKDHFAGKGLFSTRLIELLDIAETTGLTEEERQEFTQSVISIFQLNDTILIDSQTYEDLKDLSPVASDILGAGLNINHLTPDTLDIDKAYYEMSKQIDPNTGQPVKMNPEIYGPPKGYDILLRQTSFKAIPIELKTPDNKTVMHQARFGEIESRGSAIVFGARKEYDICLSYTNAKITNPHINKSNKTKQKASILEDCFSSSEQFSLDENINDQTKYSK
ncbi:UNVERIFIED_CONTAM: hypothetical protein GTU68_043475, partial [Idotea baltica]|nr:hypothetical protein [Idotea baltica]